MGEVRRAESSGGLRCAVVLRDPGRKGAVRFMNNGRMRKDVGLAESRGGSRLKIMMCSSSTLTGP